MSKGSAYFEGKYGDNLEIVRRAQRVVAKYLAPHVKEGSTILDVGAADGHLGELIMGYKEKPYFTYDAIDIHPVDKSRVEKGDIHTALDSHYDLLIYNHVLEHIYDPYEELLCAWNALIPGGLIFIAVPHSDASWSWAYEGHLFMYNEMILSKALGANGFVVLESFTITFREDKKELWTLAQKHSR